ncbi:MAG: hypothetical protein JO267_07325 [Alphaproteobacteria bacterium]|nr:hypothetical protein [Alphaproteobacteria bacterium]MBV9861943.1 hypothetical protein [Alphaproteobacteria bacterium]
MATTDPMYPGYEQGWVVVRGDQAHQHLIGIFASREEAEAAAAREKTDCRVIWGAYNRETKDLLAGDVP